MTRKTVLAISAAVIFGGGVTAFAMQEHTDHDGHNMPTSTANTPSETGQSAFAAMAEIVRMLDSDPDTDWSKVSIQALRDHLVDMNELTLNAEVKQQVNDATITYFVTGEGNAIEAIQAMVSAHALQLDKMDGWSASTSNEVDGAKLMMQPATEVERTKILGLGFFGLMVTGAHHQPHHFGIATGQMTH
jgi:hypothetical protein